MTLVNKMVKSGALPSGRTDFTFVTQWAISSTTMNGTAESSADCSDGGIIAIDFSDLLLTGSFHDFVQILNFNFGILEILFLKGNNFTGPLPDAICQQTQLQFLSVSTVPFMTGPLPSCLGQLKNLRTLSFRSSPELTGPIPTTLTSLPHLKFLNLASCAFNGTLTYFSALPGLAIFLVNGIRIQQRADEKHQSSARLLHEAGRPDMHTFVPLTSHVLRGTPSLPACETLVPPGNPLNSLRSTPASLGNALTGTIHKAFPKLRQDPRIGSACGKR
ncbi:hypothetical protein DFJ73DRAFT_793351 [Zopfochytrium polystomum]|nr:hypothetical protein DFJ73DRAFT_793351 [Zopfochytrium polystomum]